VWHSHQSESDGETIVYDALQGNPSYVAHSIHGMDFVHMPTPSAPDESPVFQMYLEALKSDGKRHLHFQFQSPHEKADCARIRQMDAISKKHENFDQVVLSFDAFRSPEGIELANEFVETEKDDEVAVDHFFDKFQEWALRDIRNVSPSQPITIPERLLSDDQIKAAFALAKEMCKDLPVGSTPQERIAFVHAMQHCLYGVLMAAIVENPELQGKTILSGGCKQDVDRGPVLNAILQFFSYLLTSIRTNPNDPPKLTPDQTAEMHATANRARIGDKRDILAKRAILGVKTLEVFGADQHRTAQQLDTGIKGILALSPRNIQGPIQAGQDDVN